MHSLHLHHHNSIHGPDAGHIMAPRDPLPAPDPLPNAIPIPAPVGDYGTQLNLTTAANPFSHGLTGVNQGLNYLFVYTLVFSFLVLLLVTLFYRWMLMVRAHLRHLLSMGREADQRYWMYNHTRFWPRVKKYLLYAPLFRNRHNQEIQLSQAVTIGTLPSRYHTILLLVYLASNAAYCLVLDWSLEHNAVIAELRGRSGVLAALNLIPTFLFMMRNNPLIPLLRVSYDTFNLLHRWCGRMVIFESIIHTIMWAVNAYEAGGSKQLGVSLETSLSYRWGMVGTAIFTFIGIVSVGPVRHAFYETFLNGHRSLVLVGMIGVYIHLDAAGLPPLPMVQVSLAFWVFEWLWRISRIIYHNASRKRGLTRVTVEWLPAEACRVTFEIKRPWKFTPGCHVHAFIPALALWSSHPFSIAWAENRPKNPPMEIEMEKLAPIEMAFTTESARRPMATSRASQYSRKSVSLAAMANAAEAAHKPEDNNLALPRESGVTTISLIVRARTGMTRKMHDKLVKQDKKPFVTWGAIEGPYGGHDSLSSYGTVILFAGGVGITHMIGHINHLMLQYQTGMSSTRKILLVWSVPNTEALEWVRVWMDQILRMEGRREVLRIQLFVTKPRHRGEVVSSTGSVQMLPGRCNPETIIRREVPERIGSIGVQVCGPGAFSDAVRSACRSVVTDCSLDFIEEAFTY